MLLTPRRSTVQNFCNFAASLNQSFKEHACRKQTISNSKIQKGSRHQFNLSYFIDKSPYPLLLVLTSTKNSIWLF
uniref:Uncharacterized protein n=1 Tax=Salvator merianae TaxID=96440 RepID=A0A8D0BE36_SALMN